MQAKTSQSQPEEEVPSLTISPEKVCFIIIKAREFDAKDEVTEPDPGSNPSDDKDWEVLEDHADDPVVEELTSLIDSLSEDEQLTLWRLLGWGGMTIRQATGRPFAKRQREPTMNARPRTCSGCPSSATS
jgi:hypothetical protein